MRSYLYLAMALALILTPNAWAEITDGTVLKRVIPIAEATSTNLLDPQGWKPFETGFSRKGDIIVCDNGTDSNVQRGASQTVLLNQTRPEPIVASVESRAVGVGGSQNGGYSLYLDIGYTDGSALWGQTATFQVGSHDFQSASVYITPERPVSYVTVSLLLREHEGLAEFRNPRLSVLKLENGFQFDGLPVSVEKKMVREGFQLRDVAARGPFQALIQETAGIKLQTSQTQRGGATFFDVTVTDTTGGDRAISLIYTIPIAPEGVRWLDDPRREMAVEPGREYSNSAQFQTGSSGRLSLYPFGAVAKGNRAIALGIDPAAPAFARVGYNASSGELFLAFDVALVPEKRTAKLRFCRFVFDAPWGFRSAVARYYELFPDAFVRRVSKQGLWMPFAPISKIPGWEDFGFAFKEGDDETAWDDAHGILTFRVEEPLTWWMPMPKDMPRTLEAAMAEARRLAATGNQSAKALMTSGYHDAKGRFTAQFINTPWNDGAVWSMNSIPGIPDKFTDFKNKWNSGVRERFYGTGRKGDLDGEYVDSSEGYVTDELDFRREHFAATDTPLVFHSQTHKPAIFSGLVAFEYIRGIERDIHPAGKLMMANGTPGRFPWLAGLLDVMGTETDWNPNGNWQPMSDKDLLYRRVLCGTKPFCFLMNTDFNQFGPDLVERYMKRCLAYGMFPGFFSHNAADGHYFSRPELYERDRPLFKKYVPLCRLVAEAGWQPVTGARSSEPDVLIERFGATSGASYLTVFNSGSQRTSVTITLDNPPTGSASSKELVRGGAITWQGRQCRIELDSEDVAVLELPR